MPAHWLQVESCRAGFKSGGKDQLNALFSVGTMKADTDSASAESVKVVDRAFLDFPCPQAWWSLNKPSGCAFGLANDSTKPFGHGKSKKARLSRLYSYSIPPRV